MTSVFAAVSDPSRRGLLDRLRVDGPLTLSELAAPLPMTRQAVSKHLGILAEAELIRVEKRGRERIHSLQAQELKALEDWLAPYAAEWDRRLDRLRRHLEEGP